MLTNAFILNFKKLVTKVGCIVTDYQLPKEIEENYVLIQIVDILSTWGLSICLGYPEGNHGQPLQFF